MIFQFTLSYFWCAKSSLALEFNSFPPPPALQAACAEDCTALLALGAGTPVAALDLVGSSEEAESKRREMEFGRKEGMFVVLLVVGRNPAFTS